MRLLADRGWQEIYTVLTLKVSLAANVVIYLMGRRDLTWAASAVPPGLVGLSPLYPGLSSWANLCRRSAAGDWRILLHSSRQNRSAPLRASPQSHSARPLSPEHSSHDIDLTCALERVLFEKAPAPARVFFRPATVFLPDQS